MNLSDLLNNSSDPRHPNDPTKGDDLRNVSGHVHLADTSGNDERKSSGNNTPLNSVLDEERQIYLLKVRCRLENAIATSSFVTQEIRDLFNNYIVGKLHRGTWDTFWPLVKELTNVDGLCQGEIITFGGWKRPFPASTVATETTTKLERLHDNLRQLELLSAQKVVVQGSPRNDPKKVLAIDKINEVINRLSDDLYGQFIFMQNQALVFYPTQNNPFAGWKEFGVFCRQYDKLPETTRDFFGPYFLLVTPISHT